MKKMIFITTLLGAIMAYTSIMAETPCTHLGHETLEGALYCAQYARASGQLDAHHAQMVSSDIPLPPQMNPYTYSQAMPYLFMSGGSYPAGFKNSHLMWPNSWSLAFPMY